MRRFSLAAILLLGTLACGRKPAVQRPVHEYLLTGTVVRLETKTHNAVIRHEAIKDRAGNLWMAAMTMSFPVKDPLEFAKLQPGHRIHATVYHRPADFTYWIAKITDTAANSP